MNDGKQNKGLEKRRRKRISVGGKAEREGQVGGSEGKERMKGGERKCKGSEL